MKIVGRTREQRSLQDALDSAEAELIAIYGRRRVGKTFLTREFFKKNLWFELVGAHGAPLREQLQNFADARVAALRLAVRIAAPDNWHQAFNQLKDDLQSLRKIKGKRVLFFDELPWLAGRRSGFLSAFEHFWNAWAVKQTWLVVVVCGSAAAWMIRRVLHARGGLHNRVTRRVRLEPFDLAETRQYLKSRRIELGTYQTLELYMTMGGIPHYLKEVRRGESASQTIDRLCFSRDGLLRDEFSRLYVSLFERPERHDQVVRALAKARSGATRNQLVTGTSFTSGGALTTVLEELEESGFIMRTPAFGTKAKDSMYRLSDEYSMFYLHWIKQHRGAAKGYWVTRRTSPPWRAWSGLAFEAVCLKHVSQLKRALGIEAVQTLESAWRHAGSDLEQGAQIDLVIDRKDECINLCEMKFSEAEFTINKKYAAELRAKRNVFHHVTRTKKATLTTLVTTYGVRANTYKNELVDAEVKVDALFDPS